MAEMATFAFSAASTALTSGSFLSTAGTVLQGLMTAGSVLGGYMEAQQTKAAGQAAAFDANLNARAEELNTAQEATNSEARALEIRRETLRKMASARVAFAGSGLDVSSGQLLAIESSLESDAEFGLALEGSNNRINQARGDIRAGQYRLQGINAQRGASAQARAQRLGALTSGARGLLSIVKRG